MKKNIKKIQLKKRSISKLNAKQATGGLPPTTIATTVVSILCLTAIYAGEDLCWSQPQRRQ